MLSIAFEVLIPSLIVLLFAGVLLYARNWERSENNRKNFKQVLTKPKNQLRNIARIRNIYLVLESTGNSPERIASFKAELNHRLFVAQENLEKSPKNSKEALVIYNKMRS